MTQTDERALPLARTNRPADSSRLRRKARPQVVDALETRALCTITGLVAHASPMILRQINPMNQPHAVQVAVIRPVTLTVYLNYVDVKGNASPTVTYRVMDEYGKDEPSGTIPLRTVNPPIAPGNLFYTTRIGLNRYRRPGDLDGRQYQIIVTAQDAQGTKTTMIPVTTPPAIVRRPR